MARLHGYIRVPTSRCLVLKLADVWQHGASGLSSRIQTQQSRVARSSRLAIRACLSSAHIVPQWICWSCSISDHRVLPRRYKCHMRFVLLLAVHNVQNLRSNSILIMIYDNSRDTGLYLNRNLVVALGQLTPKSWLPD